MPLKRTDKWITPSCQNCSMDGCIILGMWLRTATQSELDEFDAGEIAPCPMWWQWPLKQDNNGKVWRVWDEVPEYIFVDDDRTHNTAVKPRGWLT